MSDPAPAAPPPAPRTSALHMYAAVMGVGVACAVAIVLVHEATRPIIAKNRIQRRNRAILDVLPGAEASAAFVWTPGGFSPASGDEAADAQVFAGYDAQHRLVGVAVEAQGRGYQDLVHVLYGYDFQRQAIIGFRVLQTRETPGLGDRIGTDAAFLQNFEALDVRLNQDGAVAHPIQLVKPGQKTAPWQIRRHLGRHDHVRSRGPDAAESSEQWMPRVHPRRSEFIREKNR